MFAPQAKITYEQFREVLAKTVKKLFAGETITPPPSSITILDIMRGGGWVNETALTPVENLSKQLSIELMSRSLNRL